MLETDYQKAFGIATAIEAQQVRRRALQEEMIAEAIREIEEHKYADRPAIVLAREGWDIGIVGIVAGRIASRFHKPTIVIGLEGVKGRGSVRGPTGSRLHDMLSLCKGQLVGFGGHQAAAGVEAESHKIEALRERLWEVCAESAFANTQGGAVQPDVRIDDRDDLGSDARDENNSSPAVKRIGKRCFCFPKCALWLRTSRAT